MHIDKGGSPPCWSTRTWQRYSTSVACDGTIEGFQIEGKSKFALGVQWHPEMMYDNEDMKKIFKAFVEACK